MSDTKKWRTRVLVIDYPEDKKLELEKILKPLAPKINTTFGEIWQPYDNVTSDDLYSILENLHELIVERIESRAKPKKKKT